ncbi:hypothetical protein J8I88_02395 [Duffyella gerundensis]|uniref:hypothetical protein n=1 Tax=Duffyella gerundensis TaxID=1619313 RepID=UPI001AE33909|nr:hypothetical protein [Duffyella gerundensis]QTO54752.1 hypothetical protein J8I88_02395 [Duffyella gerundensis]
MTAHTYLPEFLVHLKAGNWQCRCAGCRGELPQLALSWRNHQRLSADIRCDAAARQILCRKDAFVLHSVDEQAWSDQPLSSQAQAMNQSVINLLIANGHPLAIRLYAVAVLLSRTHPAASEAQIKQVEQELQLLLEHGYLHNAFAELPLVARYAHRALQQLGERTLDVNLDAVSGTRLMMKLNEVKVLNAGYQQQMLMTLRDNVAVQQGLADRDVGWLNFLLYRCYHDLFPGNDATQWPQQFMTLCADYNALHTLVALLLQEGIVLDDEMFAALVAGYLRGAQPLAEEKEALLIGLALLK